MPTLLCAIKEGLHCVEPMATSEHRTLTCKCYQAGLQRCAYTVDSTAAVDFIHTVTMMDFCEGDCFFPYLQSRVGTG